MYLCNRIQLKQEDQAMAIRERRKQIYRKRIPYGMQNFEDVIKEDCFYVDKTPFIEDIEDSNMYFFYLRRFFNTIKGAANTSLGRIFVTGVSPVTMDDLTSGFNIVRESIKTTKLHKLVVIYRGAEMVACEEADI